MMVSFWENKGKCENVKTFSLQQGQNEYQKFASTKGRKCALKPFPRADANDESKNRYLAKLTRVQCHLNVCGKWWSCRAAGRRIRVAEERGQESAKIRLKKARKRKKEGKKESEGREGKVQFKCSLERGGVGAETRR